MTIQHPSERKYTRCDESADNDKYKIYTFTNKQLVLALGLVLLGRFWERSPLPLFSVDEINSPCWALPRPCRDPAIQCCALVF